jgi:RNA polymerase sigma-70 factor, ECF subfamily
LAAVSPVGRATGLEPLDFHAESHAAGALYEVHSSRVFAYCLSKLGRREDAEDAVQTTFLHAVRGLRRGVVPSVEIAWLLGIARNVCLSRFESAGRRGRLELVCDPVDLERSAAPQGRRDELIGLEQALARLPEQQRHAVLLRDWRGLSYEEVATQLGVSLANAETLIFRGRRALADHLEEKPTTVRRRLAALGNLGSLASAIKSAFTGAAAATKLAAVVAVVAVSSAGVAVGTGAVPTGGATVPAAGTNPQAGTPGAAATPDAQTVAPGTWSRAAIVAAPQPKSKPNATPVPVPEEREAGTPAGAPTSASPTAGSATPTSEAARPAPTSSSPVPAVKVPNVAGIPETVESTVEQLVPALPIPAPALPPVPPVVETVAESIPPVTVTPPPVVPVAPITVDPPKLLP